MASSERNGNNGNNEDDDELQQPLPPLEGEDEHSRATDDQVQRGEELHRVWQRPDAQQPPTDDEESDDGQADEGE